MKSDPHRRIPLEGRGLGSKPVVLKILIPDPRLPLIGSIHASSELNERIEIWINEGGAGGEVNR